MEESLADLIGSFVPANFPRSRGGLNGEYRRTRGFGGAAANKAFDRVDPLIQFNFREGSPATNIAPKGIFHSLEWSGSSGRNRNV